MNRVPDPRLAGGVSRWHTEAVIGHQNVAEHGWHVARIVLALWPQASRELIVECLMHDIGEVVAGDPPGPAKVEFPAMGNQHQLIEDKARLAMAIPWGVPSRCALSSLEHKVLKLADSLEAWEWAMQNLAMGNLLVYEAVTVLKDRVTKRMRELSDPNNVLVDKIYDAAQAYLTKREHTWNWRMPMSINAMPVEYLSPRPTTES